MTKAELSAHILRLAAEHRRGLLTDQELIDETIMYVGRWLEA